MKSSIWLTLAVLITLVASLAPLGPTTAAPTPPDLLQGLLDQTGGQARIAYQDETGMVSFIGTDRAHPVSLSGKTALQAVVSPDAAALAYLETYGPLFGLTDPAAELLPTRSRAEAGTSMHRYQQTYRGVPVLGAELIVNLDQANNLLSASGEALPGLAISTSPAVSAEQARAAALQATAKAEKLDLDFLAASEPELVIYDARILGGKTLPGSRLAWRVDVTPTGLYPLNELVLVDAQRGAIMLQFNQIDTALNRAIYDKNNERSNSLPGNLVKTEGGGAAGFADAEFAYQFAGDTYNFFMTRYGRDSLNRAGMPLISTTRFCTADPGVDCPYPNAFWNGSQMVYGQGYASADDVVGHEMAHGITSNESNLFYFYQSGAINEALSDILGEFIDQTNAYTTGDIPWQLGEGLPGDLSNGIRNMANPQLSSRPQPDRMTSLNYECDTALYDNGGVHTNSGVANKAAYLMTAGGSFNGQTITGIGVDKAAAIWYKVNTDLLTSASDYADLASALPQACQMLVGTGGMTTADCGEVQKAVLATAMSQPPSGCAALEAPVACPSGLAVTPLFFDDLENPASGNWTAWINYGGLTWYYPQTLAPYIDDLTYATSGTTNFFADDVLEKTDSVIQMNNAVALPAGQPAYLHFKHAFLTETWADGGVVEISIDGGLTWGNLGPQFDVNGYNDRLWYGSSPLGAMDAFTGSSSGYISSRASLASQAGKAVKVRFNFATDEGVYAYGWFIDDISIYTCTNVSSYPNKLFVPFIQNY